jgi:uncharacterized protein YnzC (UPF0291/DUF896 family)
MLSDKEQNKLRKEFMKIFRRRRVIKEQIRALERCMMFDEI